jgi:simple sugar transport system substrate-binding protein
MPIVGVVTVALMLTACSGRGDTTTEAVVSADFSTVTIVTPATESDHGWNQMGLVGARIAAEATGLTLTENAGVGYDNIETILTQAAEKEGVGLVIAHASGFAKAADNANKATGIPMLIADFPDQQIEGRVGVVTFSAQQGGYLAGIAAAMTTTTNKVGIAVSAEDLNWFSMSGGFVEGARSVNPDIDISIAYVGAAAYDDSAGGKKVVQQLIASGADVIFGMGDGATIGYVAAVDEANAAGTPVKYIADIGDVTDIVTTPGAVLTSVLWNFEGAYEAALKDVIAGTFATAPYDLNLDNGGIALQDTDSLTADIKNAVKTATAGISDGSITVSVTSTKDLLTALLAK